MSHDGKTELCRQTIFDGGDGVDPVENGTIPIPTIPNTETTWYAFEGWSYYINDFNNSALPQDILKNVTSDRYVYAAFGEWDRVN